MTGRIRPEFRVHPQAGTSSAGISAAAKGFSTSPAQLTRNDSGIFKSPASPILPGSGRGSVPYRYGILGNNTRRLRSNSSMDHADLSNKSSKLTRHSSLSDLNPDATQHVKINGQEYFTTKEPMFEGDIFLLNKVGGTAADELLGRQLKDGTWVAHPADNIGFKFVTLDGQKYTTSPFPTFDNHTYLLYPISPNGIIRANDAAEGVLLPDGRWAIVVPSQNTVPATPPPSTSSSAPGSTRSATPSSLRSGTLSSMDSSTPVSTQPSTPASTAFPSREGSQSPEPPPAGKTGDGANASFFSSLWQRLKNIF